MINVESNCDDKTLKSQEIREGTGMAGLEREQKKGKKKSGRAYGERVTNFENHTTIGDSEGKRIIKKKGKEKRKNR